MYNPYNRQSSEYQNRVMTVVGNANIPVKPNIALIQLAVKTEHEQLNQAVQENSYQMNQVIQALVQFGILRENIQTASLQVQHMYDFVEGIQEFKGFEVINIITIRMEDIDQVGNVIEIAIQNGANQISNLQYSLDNPQSFERQAIIEALEDAKGKAQTIAHQMHITIDPIPVKVIEDVNEQIIPYVKSSIAEHQSIPPIEPGLIQIQAKVHVNFQY